ncbi:MAG TPA: CBS domain-containing protein [Candidatus Bathyarchaeia archaeon]|nr:CBS domain-containing protein [Candidatus Bathyarchaeia archaeon]
MELIIKDVPIADDLRRMRKNAGYTQKILAVRAGVSQSLIARIEKGAVDPRLSTVQKIMRALIVLSQKKIASDIMHKPVVTISANEKIRKAVEVMRKYNISQLPVTNQDEIIGSIQETTIIEALLVSKDSTKVFDENVANIMETGFISVNSLTPLEHVLALLSKGRSAVLVEDKGKIVGIITKIDVVASLTHEEMGNDND